MRFFNQKLDKAITTIVLLLSIHFQMFSQQGKAFKVRYKGHLKGDVAMIANNIVNRVEGVDNANSPYNEIVPNLSKINDEFDMNYIDIDDDKSTFSSSSATLNVDNANSKKIVYAGLYWTATYPCKSSKLMKRGRFEVTDAARETFDEIKIKLPNQSNYTSIKGEVIFDGYNNPDFKESAPYVVYKDITDMVKGANSFGTYTVADVKSTIGKISGGVAAGWSIFFVYEDSTLKGKSITSYDGFVGVTEKSLDITFSGFKTAMAGSVNAKIACAALEGDTKLKGDQLLIRDSKAENFTSLSNTLRNKINVFNSSITMDDARFNDRKPNSANTLGFDSFLMTIDNIGNTVIGNNTEEAVVRLKTSGDRFFMYFNALQVEDETSTDAIKEEVQKTADLALEEKSKGDIKAGNSNINTLKEDQKLVSEIAEKLKNEEEGKVASTLEEKSKSDIKTGNSTTNTLKEDQKLVLEISEKLKKEEEEKVALALEEKLKNEKEALEAYEKLKKAEEQKAALLLAEKENEDEKIAKDKEKELEKAEKLALKEEEKIKKDLAKVVTDNAEVASLTKSKKQIKEEKLKEDLESLNGVPRKKAKGKYRTEARVEPIESPSVPILEAKKGYYIVANVFAVKSNAKRFKKKLRRMGIKADYYYNRANKYRYVYTSKHSSFEDAKQLYYTNINGLYFDELWIMTVNMPKTDTTKPEDNNLTAQVK